MLTRVVRAVARQRAGGPRPPRRWVREVERRGEEKRVSERARGGGEQAGPPRRSGRRAGRSAGAGPAACPPAHSELANVCRAPSWLRPAAVRRPEPSAVRRQQREASCEAGAHLARFRRGCTAEAAAGGDGDESVRRREQSRGAQGVEGAHDSGGCEREPTNRRGPMRDRGHHCSKLMAYIHYIQWTKGPSPFSYTVSIYRMYTRAMVVQTESGPQFFTGGPTVRLAG